jgi:transglutaminase-like putative cysteine protease
MEKRHSPAIAILAAAIVLFGSRADAADIAYTPRPAGAPTSKLRQFRFTYHADIPITNSSARKVEAWIPLPRVDPFQKVTDLEVDTPVHHEIIEQASNGNRVEHLEAEAPLPTSIPFTMTFVVVRREESADMIRAARPVPEPTDGAFATYLQPDRLVPINGRIARVSSDLSETGVTPLEQARVIYEYVTSVMKYDKSGSGWGRGDAIYACDVRRGNCTDFHSLFMGLARARGIPVRFTIGFPLSTASSGTIPGYHCWAEFYAGGEWIPVDASEAWKHPDRHDYYFGRLDADRVAFTMGRDLVLDPPQRGEPLNYLVFPYVEIDGVALSQKEIKPRFEYAEAGMEHRAHDSRLRQK